MITLKILKPSVYINSVDFNSLKRTALGKYVSEISNKQLRL